MLSLFGPFPDAKHPTPLQPLQPPPPTPHHPGEPIPYIHHRHSNHPNPWPWHEHPHGYSLHPSRMETDPLHGYATLRPLDGYLSHREYAGRQLERRLQASEHSNVCPVHFLDHNEIGNVEGEEDPKDISARKALEARPRVSGEDHPAICEERDNDHDNKILD
ncbi:hypothetical protein HYALB_00005778 [Hymenoscyphus albidus]|uniref:Uncharacterized protein n=1 Tax=Hymenoscyphus albidus TaxID=595503 RepID=A0A9N9Q2C6_9HELO|nr:hypothetical protein HYALB_00005778 [Hymenoscyphus albidus]